MTTLYTPLNQLATTLGAAYTAASGSLVLAAGYGAVIAAELAAEGAPSISASHPIRVSVAAAAHANDNPIAATRRTIFKATGLSGDMLTGAVAIEGTTDRSYALGDVVRVNLTAGAIADLNAAAGAAAAILVPTVWCSGDSLTFGQGLSSPSTQSIVAQAQALLGAGWNLVNEGRSGYTAAQLATADLTLLDPVWSWQRPQDIVLFWAGTNDLYFGASAATTYANIVAYCQARRLAGRRVIVTSMLPRLLGSGSWLEADRQTVNAAIRFAWQTFADEFCDIAAITAIGAFGANLNTTNYQSDGTHLTAAGVALAAPGYAAAILRLANRTIVQPDAANIFTQEQTAPSFSTTGAQAGYYVTRRDTSLPSFLVYSTAGLFQLYSYTAAGDVFDIDGSGNVSAVSFGGSGAGLTGIPHASVVGLGSAALTASSAYDAAGAAAAAVAAYTGSTSLVTVGTITTGTWQGTPIAAAYLASTAVTPGSYTSTNLTVDQQGRITAAASGSGGGITIGATPVSGGTAGAFVTVASGPVASETSGITTPDGNSLISLGSSSAPNIVRLPGGTPGVDELQIFMSGTPGHATANIVPPGTRGLAIGFSATASADYTMAFGYGATASNTSATASGLYASATGNASTAIGPFATANKTSATCIGSHATASGPSGTSIGVSATASSASATAIGRNVTASGLLSTAAGAYATAIASNSTAIGNNTVSRIIYTLNTTPIIVRKDNGEVAGTAFYSFGGVRNTFFSKLIDLTSVADQSVTLSAGCSLFVDEVGLVLCDVNTMSVDPTIRFGHDTSFAALLAATTATVAAAGDRDRFTTLLTYAGQKVLTAGVTVGATATSAHGRFYWNGILVEDQ